MFYLKKKKWKSKETLLCLASLKGGRWAANYGGLWEEDGICMVSDPFFKYLEEQFKPEVTEYAVQVKMRTPEPCWLIDPHPACAFEHTHCPGLRRARAAPAGSRAALPAPPAPSGPGGVFREGEGGRSGEGGDPGAAMRRAAVRGVGTSLHAVVMRGASVSVLSLVTPGRSAPPPPAGARLRPSALRPLGAVLFPVGASSGCQDLPLLRPFSQPFCRSHDPLACDLFLPRWASGVLLSPLILFFYFQITSAGLPCGSCARGGKSPLGW